MRVPLSTPNASFEAHGRFRSMAFGAFRYDANGHDQDVDLTEEQLRSIEDNQLLWIDVDQPTQEDLKTLTKLLALDPLSLDHIKEPGRPRVDKYPDYLQFSVVTSPSSHIEDGRTTHRRNLKPETEDFLHFLVADKWIVTIHCGELEVFKDFRAKDRAETAIGELSTADFTASLLDLHLETFFGEIAKIEELVDALDEQALINPSGRTLLARMVAVRRRVAKVRASLAAQRSVFYSLSRPDLQVASENSSSPHFEVLIARYERALDEAEHARDLVVGSFELFASRTAQQTNELVKILTYLTAVIGICAAVAGLFGMNFETSFFHLGNTGFYSTIFGLLVLMIIATVVARWRNWI